MFLTWLPPEDTGLGRDLSYKVSYHDIHGTSYTWTIATNPYHNVTGLSPNTPYTMTVMADNGISENEENRRASVNVTTNTITTGTVYYVMYVAVQCIVHCIAVRYNHCITVRYIVQLYVILYKTIQYMRTHTNAHTCI